MNQQGVAPPLAADACSLHQPGLRAKRRRHAAPPTPQGADLTALPRHTEVCRSSHADRSRLPERASVRRPPRGRALRGGATGIDRASDLICPFATLTDRTQTHEVSGCRPTSGRCSTDESVALPRVAAKQCSFLPWDFIPFEVPRHRGPWSDRDRYPAPGFDGAGSGDPTRRPEASVRWLGGFPPASGGVPTSMGFLTSKSG